MRQMCVVGESYEVFRGMRVSEYLALSIFPTAINLATLNHDADPCVVFHLHSRS